MSLQRLVLFSLFAALVAGCGGKKKQVSTDPPTAGEEEPFPDDEGAPEDDFGSIEFEEPVDPEPAEDADIDTTDAEADAFATLDDDLGIETDAPAEDPPIEDDFLDNLPEDDDLPEEIETTETAPAPGKPCKFETVYFAFDSANLRADTIATLGRAADCLRNNPQQNIRISGHCDERGTRAYNDELGRQRAQAVRSFLIDQGIAANRLATVSFGEDRPRARGHNEMAWRQNRRTEMGKRRNDLVILWGTAGTAKWNLINGSPELNIGRPEWQSPPDVQVGSPQWQ